LIDANWIDGIQYGDRIQLDFDPAQIEVTS
jgi:hypothetical protein